MRPGASLAREESGVPSGPPLPFHDCGVSEGWYAAMLLIYVDQSKLVDDLVENLRGRCCRVERGDGNVVLTSIGKSLSAEGSRRELDLYLRAWEAKRPDGRATRVGER